MSNASTSSCAGDSFATAGNPQDARVPDTAPGNVDERLHQLLDIERRLQELVRNAKDAAARRIAAARDASERRLIAARHEAEQADVERARAEQIAWETELAAVERNHRAAIEAITGFPESRVDALARWALARAIGGSGEST